MWPFKKTLIAQAVEPVALQLKSLSLPQALPNWSLYSRSQEGWDTQTAIIEGYNASAIVYACIEKRAKLLASIPLLVEQRVGDEWETVPEQHPLRMLLDSPNPDQSLYEIMYGASQQLDLSGNAYITEIKAGTRGLPRELWLLPSKGMQIKPGRVNLIDYYEYNYSGINRRIETADMIHVRMPNPDNPYFGMPVLKAAGRATDIDRESGIWQKVSLENRGAADINIKMPADATPDQINAAKEQYRAQQAGSKNARKALITNADIQQLGQTAVELDFVASRRSVWTEICAAFGMSLANLGMTEDVNLANAGAMDKALWQNTIVPQLRLFERQLTHQLASEFGDNLRIRGDLSNIEALQESQTEKLDKAEKLHRLGVPFNLINQHLELGFEDIEGGDVGYIASGLIPVTYNMAEPEADPTTAGREAYGDPES